MSEIWGNGNAREKKLDNQEISELLRANYVGEFILLEDDIKVIFPWDYTIVNHKLSKIINQNSKNKEEKNKIVLEILKGFYTWMGFHNPENNYFYSFDMISPFSFHNKESIDLAVLSYQKGNKKIIRFFAGFWRIAHP